MTIKQRKKEILNNIEKKLKGTNETEKKIILKEMNEVSNVSYIELEKHNTFFNS